MFRPISCAGVPPRICRLPLCSISTMGMLNVYGVFIARCPQFLYNCLKSYVIFKVQKRHMTFDLSHIPYKQDDEIKNSALKNKNLSFITS